MALTEIEKKLIDKMIADGKTKEEIPGLLAKAKEKLGLSGGSFMTRAASMVETAPSASPELEQKATAVKEQFPEMNENIAEKSEAMPTLLESVTPAVSAFKGLKDIGSSVVEDVKQIEPDETTQKLVGIKDGTPFINPAAPLQNAYNTTAENMKAGATMAAEGLTGQVKENLGMISPLLAPLQGKPDQKGIAGENLRKTFDGATQVLSSVFMPLISALPGGEKAATLINPSTWTLKAFKMAAEDAGLDTTTPEFIEAENQIRTATDIADIALIPSVYQKAQEFYSKNAADAVKMPEIKESKTYKQNLSGLSDLETKNSAIKKATMLADNQIKNAAKTLGLDEAKMADLDIKNLVADSDLLADAVSKDGRITTRGDGMAVDKVTDYLKPQEGVVTELLKQEGKAIDVADLETRLMDEINNAKFMGENKTKAINKVKAEIDGLKLDVKDGKLSLSQIQDAKISKNSGINWADPTAAQVDRMISNIYKKVIEETTTSADVAKLNAELSIAYAVRDYLEALDGKVVKGGRLGGYASGLTGAIAGSYFGPLGSIIGAELGQYIRSQSVQGTFKGTGTGLGLETSSRMAEAMDKTNPSTIQPKTPPKNPKSVSKPMVYEGGQWREATPFDPEYYQVSNKTKSID